jgi:hypothetical protein
MAEFGVWGRQLQPFEIMRLWNTPPTNLAPASFLLTWPAEPGLTMTEANTFQMHAPASFGDGVTLSLTATGTPAPSSLAYTAVGSMPFIVTPTAAPMTIVFTLTGTDAVRFNTPLTLSVPHGQSISHSQRLGSAGVLRITSKEGAP